MALQAAKKALESITGAQEAVHFLDPSNDEDKITNLFYKPFEKTTWLAPITAKLESISKGKEISYRVNESFHHLMETYMIVNLPAIEPRAEYKGKVRFCWTHAVGNQVVERATFKENDEIYQTIDSHWMNIRGQFYLSNKIGSRENYERGVGLIKELEEWNTEYIPATTLNIKQPWFYSEDSYSAFPIWAKGENTKATHDYTFRNRIEQLLRVQILDEKTEKWVYRKTALEKYLNIQPELVIDTPELWGRYALVTPGELKYLRDEVGTHHYYIKTVEFCDNENSVKYGKNATVQLNSLYECYAIHFMAQNNVAVKKNNYGNYTTNDEDPSAGWNPIKHVTLKFNDAVMHHQMPSTHFTDANPRDRFPSCPRENGYYAMPVAYDPSNYDGDVGWVFNKNNATLVCSIADGNPYQKKKQPHHDDLADDEDEDDDDDGTNYTIICRLLVVRKFNITKNSEGKFTLTLS